MKKLLVLVVIATMVLTSMATSFAAYTDVPADYPYAEAINKGTAVGLWKGTADGSVFDPGMFYSKEMVAATAVRIAGLEAYTAYNNTKPAFADADKIPTWAWSYVNVAAAMGLVNGTPNGKGGYNFYNSTNKLITYAEVVAIFDRAVGYDVGVSPIGKWYGLYLGKAAEIGMMEKIGTINPEGNAVRGMVAQMAWNVAQVPLVTKDNNGIFQPVAGSPTLLSSKLKGTEATVVPTEATLTGFKARPANFQVANVADKEYVGSFNKADLGKTINIISLATIDGKNNVVYYKDVTPAANIVTPALDADTIKFVDNNPGDDQYFVSVKDADDYEIIGNVVIYLNGTSATAAQLETANPKTITVILNANGKAQAIIATNYDFENYVLTAAKDNTAPTLDTVTFNNATKNIAANATITKDGAAATIADLKAVANKAVVYGRYNAAQDAIVEIAAYSSSVSGVVTKTKVVATSSGSSRYVVLADGTEVEIDATLANWVPTNNNEVQLVLNKDAKAVIVAKDQVVQNFGKVTANLTSTSTDVTINIKGTATTYTFASNATINSIGAADAATHDKADVKKDNYAYLTLNAEGKVSKLDEFALVANAKAVKFVDATNSNIVLSDNSTQKYNSGVVVELIGGTYGTVTDLKADDAFSAYINGNNEALYVLVTTQAADSTKYGKYVGYSIDGGVISLSVEVNGVVENLVVGKDNAGNDLVKVVKAIPADVVPTLGGIVAVGIDGPTAKVKSCTDIAYTTEAAGTDDVVLAISGSDLYYNNSYGKVYQLDSNVAVYTFKNNAYTLASKADIVKDAKIQVYVSGKVKVVKIVK